MSEVTPYMRDILRVVVKGNGDGSFCDLDQVLDRLLKQRSKQSCQFTIRAMIKRGLIAKHSRQTRRGRNRVVLVATELGYSIAREHFTPEEANELGELFRDEIT